MRLNLGCGRSPLDGWVNVDSVELPGVDVVADLEAPLPFADDSVDESFGSHVLEHLHRPLDFMAELWRITKPGGVAVFRLPHGGSDDAWEDPTHTRPYFIQSSLFFGQPGYHRADYGYRADWATDLVELHVDGRRFLKMPDAAVLEHVQTLRNVVLEMRYTLSAVKPIREPVRDESLPPIRIIRR